MASTQLEENKIKQIPKIELLFVFLICKKRKQESDVVGDISSLFDSKDIGIKRKYHPLCR